MELAYKKSIECTKITELRKCLYMLNEKTRTESGGGECSIVVSSYQVSNCDWYS